jgi:hypothetical protein
MRINYTLGIWLHLVAVQSLKSKGVGNGKESYVTFQCASSISHFETSLFMDVKVSSRLDFKQLRKLEDVVHDGYNALKKKNYCDLNVRRIQEVEASIWAELNADVHRLLLTVIGTCRGCSADTNILALGSARSSSPITRGSKKKSPPKNGDKQGSTCSCSSKATDEIPSSAAFVSYLQEKVSSVSKSLNIISIQEVDAQDCADESSFEALVETTFTSEKKIANANDMKQIPIGFKHIYNGLQENSCDDQFRKIDKVIVRSNVNQSLMNFQGNNRKLQVVKKKFILIINMAVKGTCRSCPKNSKIFKNGENRRYLQMKQSSSVCFCHSGRLGPPSATEFIAKYSSWIEEERLAGRIIDLLGVNATSQRSPSPTVKVTIRPSAEFSFNPSFGPSVKFSINPSFRPSTKLSGNPSSLPSTFYSTNPSPSPSVKLSSNPSSVPSTGFDESLQPSMQPSTTPTELPSSSVLPSSFNSVCIPSDSIPSPYPRPNDQLSSECLGTLSEVLFQHFEDCKATGWTNAKIDSSGSNFSHFLGRYRSGNAFPQFSLTNINVTMVQKLFLSFTFFEIDEWEGFANDIDTLSLRVTGDYNDTVKFGPFIGNYSEISSSGKSSEELLFWKRKSDSIESSPQGFSKFPDQKHRMTVEVPVSFYARQGAITVIISWRLVGMKQKSVGIDDFLVTKCVHEAVN